MQEHKEVTEYLSLVTPRLRADGFKTTENVTYKNQSFRCVAKRTRFQFEFSSFVESFFVFAEFSAIDKTSLKEFTSKCFRYAKSHRSVPLPRGLMEGVLCFPVALCNSTATDITEYIHNNMPPMHWAFVEMPVIYNLRTRRLYYFEKTPLWGSLYWDYYRRLIVTMLSP